MRNLFDDADADAAQPLSINAGFAEHYRTRKQREELTRLQDKYSDNESDAEESTSESEDSDAALLTAALDSRIHETILALRARDPVIYDSSVKFFADVPDQPATADTAQAAEAESSAPKTAQKEKPYRLADYHRDRLLDAGGDYEADLESEQEDDKDAPVTHVAEQESLKRAFISAADGDQEQEDQELFVESTQSHHAIPDIPLPPLPEPETADQKFLYDFVLNKGWLDRDDDDNERGFNLKPLPESDTETNASEAEDFERAYNFRFEEPDAGRIATHARDVPETLRRKEPKRKSEREAKKQRDAEKKLQKAEELKRLKNLKKQEIAAKLAKIREIAGSGKNKGDDALGDALDDDFDPDEHDAKMRAMFNDEYYDGNEPACGADSLSKPIFSDMSDDDEAAPEKQEQTRTEYTDADIVKFTRNNPQDESTLQPQNIDAYLDEYYQLDYEDTIGDLPTRFKYRMVEPESFALDPAEIIYADEKDLNEYVSLKKLAPYRREDKVRRDRARVEKRGKKKLVEIREKVARWIKKDEERMARESEFAGGKKMMKKGKKRGAEQAEQRNKKPKSR